MLNKPGFITRLFKDEFWVDSFCVFFGSLLVGGVNFFYHLVSVRMLSTEDYGLFNALISFVMFATMTVSPLGMALTRFFTEYIAGLEYGKLLGAFRRVSRDIIFAVIFVIAGFLFFDSRLAVFFKTRSINIFVLSLIIAVSLFSVPILSLLQSFQKFKTFSFLGLVTSLGKLATGVILIALGFGVLGALFGFFLGSFLSFVVVLFLLPGIIKKKFGALPPVINADLSPIYRYFIPVSLTMLFFNILTGVDVILVKHYFSDLDAGYYSIAQMVGKVFFFIPSALAVVILPKSAEVHSKNGNSFCILRKSLLVSASICLLGVVCCAIFPGFVLKILAGKSNPISADLLWIFALVMSFFAAVWLTVNFLIATRKVNFILPFGILVALQVIAISIWHATLFCVLQIMLVFSVLSFLLTFLFSVWDRDVCRKYKDQ